MKLLSYLSTHQLYLNNFYWLYVVFINFFNDFNYNLKLLKVVLVKLRLQYSFETSINKYLLLQYFLMLYYATIQNFYLNVTSSFVLLKL